MTREEAISIMKVIVHMLEEKYDTDRVEEAVDMAIKALEQEPKASNSENPNKCHTCKHYTSGENDGSCGSYICKGYSNWESEEQA